MNLCWAAIYEKLALTDIAEIYAKPGISHEQILNDLVFLEPIFPDSYLQAAVGPTEIRESLADLLGPQTEIVGFHCWRLHTAAQILRECSLMPGFERLSRQLATDRGFMNQLKATWVWAKFLPIIGVEQVIDGHDIDILSNLSGTELKVHIKTIDQNAKATLVFESFAQIGSILSKDRSPKDNKPLGLAEFDGVVPRGLTRETWEALLRDIPRAPGTHQIQIDPDHTVKLRIDYTTEGVILGPDEFRNYSKHRQAIAERIPLNDKSINLLLGVTTAPAKKLKLADSRYLVNSGIDLEIFMGIYPAGGGFFFQRSEVFCRRGMEKVAADLAEKLPCEQTLLVAEA